MTVKELMEKTGLTPVALPDPDRKIECGYAGDLLSWVMGRAQYGCAWMTIMTNRNIAAVAQLIDMACVIVTEGSDLEPEVGELCRERGINVLTTDLPTYEMCAKVAELL